MGAFEPVGPFLPTTYTSGDNSPLLETTSVENVGGTSGGFLESPTFSPIDLGGGFTFDANANPTDPTNTGDTGVLQNTSSAPIPGINNPETGGTSDWGSVLSSAINAGFASWQLASQPKSTPKTITTKVGSTSVVSGQPGLLASLGFGTGAQAQSSNNLFLLLLIGLVILLIYKAVK